MKNYPPKETAWPDAIYNRLEDMDTTNSSFLNDRETTIKYLKLWDRTHQNNSHATNIIPFEELIYIECKYKNDYEIQNLVYNIKERTAHLYELKMKWMDTLLDRQLFENINATRHKRAIGLELYYDREQESYE